MNRPIGIIARATNGDGSANRYRSEVLRTIDGALLVCIYRRVSARWWLTAWEPGEWTGTPQQLADKCALDPGGRIWIEQNAEGWDALAERWDAARDEQYERRMEGTDEE